MAHPSDPRCAHATPAGLSSAPTSRATQHAVQPPHVLMASVSPHRYPTLLPPPEAVGNAYLTGATALSFEEGLVTRQLAGRPRVSGPPGASPHVSTTRCEPLLRRAPARGAWLVSRSSGSCEHSPWRGATRQKTKGAGVSA